MDEVKPDRNLEDILREAAERIYGQRNHEPQEPAAPSCGCGCGDISTHDEDTVLEGIVLDPGDQTFENRRYQESMHDSWL